MPKTEKCRECGSENVKVVGDTTKYYFCRNCKKPVDITYNFNNEKTENDLIDLAKELGFEIEIKIITKDIRNFNRLKDTPKVIARQITLTKEQK